MIWAALLRRKCVAQEEDEKQHRLEEAEKELEYLKARAWAAEKRLTDRHERNHWAESIERLITGGTAR